MKRIAWMIGLVLPLALLSGCAVTAPELPKSSTKPPEKFVAQNILQNLSSVKDAGVAGVRWWEGMRGWESVGWWMVGGCGGVEGAVRWVQSCAPT